MDLMEKWGALTMGDAAFQYVVMIVAGVAHLYLAGCVFFVLERIRPAVPTQKFFKSDFTTEALYPLINAMVSTPVFTLISVIVTVQLLEPYAPYHVFDGFIGRQPFVIQVLFVLLVADIGVWLEHWFAHKVLWNYHAMHHMTPEVNWLTHARVHPVNGITIAVASLVVHFLFGLDGEATATATVLAFAISMWEHANMDFAWPKPFCYLLVSPRFHRWHHSSDAEAIDKNFCLIFPFLDLLMGTYYCPDRMPTAYGLHRASASDPVPPATFSGQMLYPFRLTLERLRGGRRPPAVGETAELETRTS